MGSESADKVYLVDGSGYIFRAFYAVAPLRTKEGFPTNALYGYLRMLLKLISSIDSQHIVVVFDAGKTTFRTEMYGEYKANRRECPEDLLKQIPYFTEFSEALGLKILMKPGYEADDIIGTLTTRLAKQGREVIIVTGDKDLMQLVSEHVSIWDTMRDQRYDREGVKGKLGVYPEQVVELLAIMGDTSDNVPGLKGAGPKTALQLIEKYQNVDNIIEKSKEIGQDTGIRNRKKLSEQIESDNQLLRLSRELVTIKTDVDLEMQDQSGCAKNISDMGAEELFRCIERRPGVSQQLEDLVRKFEFSSLVKDFKLDMVSPDTAQKNFIYQIIYEDEFDSWVEKLAAQKIFAFDLETSSLDTLQAEIVGASFCWEDEHAYYIPLAHSNSERRQVSVGDFIRKLRDIFENNQIRKAGQNLKYDIGVLTNYSVGVRGIYFDTMIAAYLLNPDRRSYNLSALAADVLNRRLIEYDELLAGKDCYADVDIEPASRYACQDAHVAWLVMQQLEEKLKAEELSSVFEDIEMPLVAVIQRMERSGVKIDINLLAGMSEEFQRELDDLKVELFALAGCEFNLNSPKQLSEILFTKLGIPSKGLKKTKTGISTDSSVLEKLAGQHPLPKLLLRYRSIHKLKSTYVDVLPTLISLKTGRVHAKFNQTQTATGRLSSSDPNLQNIPIQTPEGQRIRRAFIAEEGNCLISADYSQIELRILAHLSGDANLISAFKNGQDIHAMTAREIMGIGDDQEVSPAARRIGKTINFGVIYGMSGFRLARELEIPVGTANIYIDNYFDRFPGVKEFFATLELEALERGYVTTLFGRKRIISDIDTSGRDKGFALRAAINAPMQGTAADLIKLAMIRLDEIISRDKLPLRMIMQIHDELVFECSEDFAGQAKTLIQTIMEGVKELSVPLQVDCKAGTSWQEAHA